MFLNKISYCAPISLVGMLFVSVSAWGLEVNSNMNISMQYTDNVKKDETNKKSDSILTAGAGVGISVDEGTVQLDASTSLEVNHYINDSFADQAYFKLNLITGWAMLKDRVNWKLNNFYTQRSVDTLSSTTPDNTQNTNVFSIGPELYYRISGRQSITVTPEYRDFYYESQDIDNQQTSLNARWSYQLFRTVNIGISGQVREVDYEDSLINDNTFDNIRLIFSTVRSGYDYSAELGMTQVSREGGSSSRGATGNMTWSLDLTAYSKIHAYIASDITDSNTSLLQANLNSNIDTASYEQTSSEASRNNTFRLNYKRNDHRLNTDVWIMLRKQTYDFALLDRDVEVIGLKLIYPLSTTLITGMDMLYSRTELIDTGREDKQNNISVNLNYRFTRKVNGTVRIKYIEKDSTVNTADYGEASIYASLYYRY